MKRIVTVYGLIAGIIVSGLLIASMQLLQHHPDSGALGMVIGFGSMLLAFVFIVVAIKNYRDRQPGGVISFGRAFRTGMWVAVIASVCYTVTWVIIFKNFYPEFADQMAGHELEALRKSGKAADVIARQTKSVQDRWAFYNTWPGLIGFTLVEILPLGLLVALVSAAILKRKVSKGPAGQPG